MDVNFRCFYVLAKQVSATIRIAFSVFLKL